MAATARVIWLCACVRYCPDRGLVFECVTCVYCCFSKKMDSHVCIPTYNWNREYFLQKTVSFQQTVLFSFHDTACAS